MKFTLSFLTLLAAGSSISSVFAEAPVEMTKDPLASIDIKDASTNIKDASTAAPTTASADAKSTYAKAMSYMPELTVGKVITKSAQAYVGYRAGKLGYKYVMARRDGNRERQRRRDIAAGRIDEKELSDFDNLSQKADDEYCATCERIDNAKMPGLASALEHKVKRLTFHIIYLTNDANMWRWRKNPELLAKEISKMEKQQRDITMQLERLGYQGFASQLLQFQLDEINAVLMTLRQYYSKLSEPWSAATVEDDADILGLSMDDFTKEDYEQKLRKHMRKLLLQNHPDKFASASAEVQEAQSEKTKKLNVAAARFAKRLEQQFRHQ